MLLRSPNRINKDPHLRSSSSSGDGSKAQRPLSGGAKLVNPYSITNSNTSASHHTGQPLKAEREERGASLETSLDSDLEITEGAEQQPEVIEIQSDPEDNDIPDLEGSRDNDILDLYP
jgi:hypothetical protein